MMRSDGKTVSISSKIPIWITLTYSIKYNFLIQFTSMYSQFSRRVTARGSCTGRLTVGPAKVMFALIDLLFFFVVLFITFSNWHTLYLWLHRYQWEKVSKTPMRGFYPQNHCRGWWHLVAFIHCCFSMEYWRNGDIYWFSWERSMCFLYNGLSILSFYQGVPPTICL